MVGLRNIVIHEYFGIDLKIIWEIVSRNLPETKPGLIAMLNDLERNSIRASKDRTWLYIVV